MSITLIIVVLTSGISLLAFNNPDITRKLAHHPYSEHHHKEYYRLLTSGFVHADMFHLFVNMFVLYGFGEFIEYKFSQIHGEIAGPIVFISFYLLMIVLAGLPNYMTNKDNPRFMSIGASGATSAVLFSFIVFRPLDILQLYFFLPIPAIVFGVLYLWYSSYASKKMSDNIDHSAHFWGAVQGFLFTVLMKKDLIIDFFNQLTSILR